MAQGCLCTAGSFIPPLASTQGAFLYAKGNSIKLKNLLEYFIVWCFWALKKKIDATFLTPLPSSELGVDMAF